MKLFTIFILAFVGTTSAFAELPFAARRGNYSGEGTWVGKVGASGKLVVTASLDVKQDAQGNTQEIHVVSKYQILGFPMGDEYFARNITHGFFTLYGKNGKRRGDGYCMGLHCHIRMPGDKLEESIVFEADGCMSRFGSKVEVGSLWSWDERLCPVP